MTIAFVKDEFDLLIYCLQMEKKTKPEKRNLKRKLQMKQKDEYETEGTTTNATVCEKTRIID